jgi:uncharacterized protein YceK
MKRRLVLTWALLLLAGCGTVNSFASACPAPYSGVKTDLEYLRSFGPGDLGDAWLVPLDLPVSLLGDTAMLPISAFAQPAPEPYPLGLGCRWAR